jgi:hypothetical protein
MITEVRLEMFSKAVLDHFSNPRNAGNLADATASVEVSNPGRLARAAKGVLRAQEL